MVSASRTLGIVADGGRWCLASLVVGALLVGCRSPAQVLVRFTADPLAAGRATSLRVVVFDTELREVSDQRFGFGDALSPLDEEPALVTLVPRDQRADRRYRLIAELVDATDAPFARRELLGGYVEGEERELWIHFDDACLDMLSCEAGTTCDRGACVPVCVSPSVPGATERSEAVPCEGCFGAPDGSPCDIDGERGRCWQGECCAGCWDGDACVAGTELMACGTEGVECSACSCEGDRCVGTGCVPAATAVRVSAGDTHVCVAGNDTGVCWGGNADGQLGTGDREPSPSPVLLPRDGLSPRASNRHTCAMVSTGEILCWGYGEEGAFPDATTSRLEPPPRSGAGGFDLTQWAIGLSHGCALRMGQLHCWGNNANGAVGLPESSPAIQIPPVRIGTDADWTRIAAQRFQTCGIRDERLFCWGFNMEGQLGVPGGTGAFVFGPTPVAEEMRFREVALGTFGTCAIDTDGRLFCFGVLKQEFPLPTELEMHVPQEAALDEWERVAVGDFHVCGLRDGGQLHCFGQNDLGQLGAPSATAAANPPVAVGPVGWQWQNVSAHRKHTCGVRADFTLWCWGDNESGQLGLGRFGDPVPEPSRVCIPSE